MWESPTQTRQSVEGGRAGKTAAEFHVRGPAPRKGHFNMAQDHQTSPPKRGGFCGYRSSGKE